MRPASSTPIAILKPSPSWPIRFFRRHAVVVELDLAGGRGADPELGLGLAAVEARQLGVDDEAEMPLAPFSGAVIANSMM